jgi:hypothetical protein
MLEFGVPKISSFCTEGGGTCLEVTQVTNGVSVRNTSTDEPATYYSYSEWAAFIQGVKLGEFDLP